MPKTPPPSAVSLLRDAWNFLRKQPVLLHVVLWLTVIPSVAEDLVFQSGRPPNELLLPPYRGIALLDVLRVLLFLLLIVLQMWGWACTMLIAKRMVQNRAGRSRSSFRSVRQDAIPLILPLITGCVLQSCAILIRSLLFLLPALIVALVFAHSPLDPLVNTGSMTLGLLILSPLLLPAVFYFIRTTLFPAALVCEDLSPREALRRSIDLVRGRLFPTTGLLLLLCVMTILPGEIVASLIQNAAAHQSTAGIVLASVLAAAISASTDLLLTLSIVSLYGNLRRGTGKPIEVKA